MQQIVFMRHSQQDYAYVFKRKHMGQGLDLAPLTENGIQIAEKASHDR